MTVADARAAIQAGGAWTDVASSESVESNSQGGVDERDPGGDGQSRATNSSAGNWTEAGAGQVSTQQMEAEAETSSGLATAGPEMTSEQQAPSGHGTQKREY